MEGGLQGFRPLCLSVKGFSPRLAAGWAVLVWGWHMFPHHQRLSPAGAGDGAER